MKSVYIPAAIIAAIFTLNSDAAYAQKFDARVGNPFVFCKAPKPCKLCHPWRAIWEDICANQAEASKEESPNPVPPPVVAPTPPVNEEVTDKQVKDGAVR